LHGIMRSHVCSPSEVPTDWHLAKKRQEGSSSRADGWRPMYNTIWSAEVPPKVRIFAWRVSQEGLATQCNRKQRTLTQSATCQICGMNDEDGHHAVARCTKAGVLRREMRKVWHLSDEEKFRYTGPDWLILLLSSVSKDMGARILLLFWRVWHLRNDAVHGKGSGSICGSVKFLISYSDSLENMSQGLNEKEVEKDKGKVHARNSKQKSLVGESRGAVKLGH
jgi:hypothetical protein